MGSSPSPKLVVGALLLVQLLFGINYVVSKIIVTNFPPLVWSHIRVVVSAVLFLALALMIKRKHPTDGSKFFGPLVIFAILGIVITQASFQMGLKLTTSTNSAVLNTMIPIFTLMIVTLRGQEKLTYSRILGFGLAFVGVLVIRRVEEFSLSNQTLIGDLLMILNSFSLACFFAFSKKFAEKHDRVWTTVWLFIYGSVGLGAVSWNQWQTFVWPEVTLTLWGCMAFAVVGATILTYFLNMYTLAHTRSSQVALFIYLQPAVTALLAWFWLDEVLSARKVLSCLLIFMGVVFALPSRDLVKDFLGRIIHGPSKSEKIKKFFSRD